jgi:4-hydroxythreonine-4-phosphate dehydrogenase
MNPLLLTQGDPAGIGPEIILKAYSLSPITMRDCMVLGNVAVFDKHARALLTAGCIPPPIVIVPSIEDFQSDSVPLGSMPLIPMGTIAEPWSLGQVSAAGGLLAAQCVQAAADACLLGQVAGMITAPMHKESLLAAGMPWSEFPGHTELLQARAARFTGVNTGEMPVRMMLANNELRVVLVSIHLPLRAALDRVTIEAVTQTLLTTHDSLTRMLGRVPRIAVAGLNPHAGEGGRFGHEERDIITPAIDLAKKQGVNASGPYPPDTIFMRARHRKVEREPEFDVVIAMYHDQGLIPVKYLGVDEGVNVTLGLPLIRTSPDHGTAFDIAGKGRARPESMMAAIAMARVLAGQNGSAREP